MTSDAKQPHVSADMMFIRDIAEACRYGTDPAPKSPFDAEESPDERIVRVGLSLRFDSEYRSQAHRLCRLAFVGLFEETDITQFTESQEPSLKSTHAAHFFRALEERAFSELAANFLASRASMPQLDIRSVVASIPGAVAGLRVVKVGLNNYRLEPKPFAQSLAAGDGPDSQVQFAEGDLKGAKIYLNQTEGTVELDTHLTNHNAFAFAVYTSNEEIEPSPGSTKKRSIYRLSLKNADTIVFVRRSP